MRQGNVPFHSVLCHFVLILPTNRPGFEEAPPVRKLIDLEAMIGSWRVLVVAPWSCWFEAPRAASALARASAWLRGGFVVEPWCSYLPCTTSYGVGCSRVAATKSMAGSSGCE